MDEKTNVMRLLTQKKIRFESYHLDITEALSGVEMAALLEIAERTYVNVNIHQKENEEKLKMLAQLPDSCEASADCLQQQRRGKFS